MLYEVITPIAFGQGQKAFFQLLQRTLVPDPARGFSRQTPYFYRQVKRQPDQKDAQDQYQHTHFQSPPAKSDLNDTGVGEKHRCQGRRK